MPSDGSGNYTLPAGYLAVANDPILVTEHNPPLEDIAAGLTARVMASGAKAMTGHLSLVSSSPSNALHAASKGYVDASLAANAQKPPVVIRTTANITLSGEQTLDGVLTSASRVLVMAQTAGAENGVYVSAAGAWSRSTDFDSWTEVIGGLVVVSQGTLYADSVWLCTNDAGGTLGSTAITFKRVDIPFKRRRANAGTTDTIIASDMGKFVSQNNGSAIAVTVPQATTLFGDGFWFITQNLGAGAATYTPTTSTVNGGATLIERTGDADLWLSDGTNWVAIPLGPTYAWLTGLTTDATAAVGDFVWTGDISATLNKKVALSTIQALFAAAQSDLETATTNILNVTPGRQHFHPGHAKARANYNGTGAAALREDYGIASLADNGTGLHTLTADTAMSNTNYNVTVFARDAGTAGTMCTANSAGTKTATTFQFATTSDSGAAADSSEVGCSYFGDI